MLLSSRAGLVTSGLLRSIPCVLEMLLVHNNLLLSNFGKVGVVNQQHLKNAWDASQKSTRDDWQEWIRRFSIELLKELLGIDHTTQSSTRRKQH
jgi:hypothetical protein